MQNGNKVTKNNWQDVIASSIKPCTNILGVPAIEAAKQKGAYYEKWKLVFEKSDGEDHRTGYIFREVNHNGGINGHHKTFKEAIWWALSHNHIKIFIED